MDKQREAFEAWAKAPPREFYLARHPDAAAWPGNYKDYHVECAWQAWQAAQQAQWLPIETAPRDGRHILLYDPFDHPCAGYWFSCEEWSGWMYADELLADVKPDGLKPTKWMPLPPEPKP